MMQRRAQGSATIYHKQLVLEILNQTGSLEFTSKTMEELKTDIRQEIYYIQSIIGQDNSGLY